MKTVYALVVAMIAGSTAIVVGLTSMTSSDDSQVSADYRETEQLDVLIARIRMPWKTLLCLHL